MVTVCDWPDRFAITIVTGPAPTLFGSIDTALSLIAPVSWTVTGGRGLSLKSLPPPQPITVGTASPPTRSVATRARPTLVILLLPHIPWGHPTRTIRTFAKKSGHPPPPGSAPGHPR